MDQKLVAAGKVMPHGADGESGLVGDLAQGSPLQTVDDDDPEDSFHDILAPDFGIDNFRHPLYLAQPCCHGCLRRAKSAPEAGLRQGNAAG